MPGGKKKFESLFGPSRIENRARAEQSKKELVQRLLAPKVNIGAASTVSSVSKELDAPVPRDTKLAERPFADARYGRASVPLFDRDVLGEALHPEPWLARLVDAALLTASSFEVRIELIWPGTIKSVAVVQALASLERFAVGDKRGLRSLLFPTKRTSFTALGKFLLGREKLLDWTREYLTITQLRGAKPPIPGRDDQDKDMLLQAVRSGWNQDPALPPPCISEVMPNFDWDLEVGRWGDYSAKYLSRTKKSLQRRHKTELFKSDRFARLGAPQTAPDALFGISHLATAKHWKAALSSEAFAGIGQPELVIFDLTKAMRDTTQRNLIRLVPEVVMAVKEVWKQPVGFLCITDDPKTYFVLRRKFLDDGENRVVSEPIVAAASDYGLSQSPRPMGWTPEPASNKHFHVEVLDQEMAEAATRFWTIGQQFDANAHANRQASATAAFLLRLANLPGGYKDYIGWMEASAFADSIRNELTWNGHVARLSAMIEQGVFADKAESVRRAIAKATALVETYNEQTPLARRIAKELAAGVGKQKYRADLVFRSNADIGIAKAFIGRQGAAMETLADRINFRIHKELAVILNGGAVPSRLVFIGLPDETLKELVTSERVPADSVVVMDWRRANTVLTGLRALKSVEAYKPYRGRIAEFGDEIERRLKEVPNSIDIEKIEGLHVRRLSLPAAAAEASRRAEGPGGAFKLELENESRVIVSQRVYLYDPDEEKPFHAVDTEKVKPGDMVFVMSDELKDMFEVALIKAGHGIPRGSNFVEMLRNYHKDVLANSRRLFGDIGASALARKIQERMHTMRPEGPACSLSRIRYWLDVEASSDSQAEDLKPHSTWSKSDFELFARALEIPDNLIGVYWLMVTGQRVALQQAGRELAERYAHILFREESAAVHFKLDQAEILELQDEAIRNTYRVIRVISPQGMNGASTGQ